MGRWISRALLKLWGFRIVGEIPADLKKYVIVAAPHTSAWDFPLGLLVRGVIQRDVKYLGKKSLFDGPFGFLFRALGGYPVDRSKNTNLVDSIVQIFDAKDAFAIVLAPEGTRRKVDKFKTGFYHIAHNAKVPLILMRINFGEKQMEFSEPYYTTDDKDGDLERIWNHYVGIKGKNPELGIG